MTPALPPGTARELRLARRAIAAARTHLQRTRQGLKGGSDEFVLRCLVELYEMRFELRELTKRKPVVRRVAA